MLTQVLTIANQRAAGCWVIVSIIVIHKKRVPIAVSCTDFPIPVIFDGNLAVIWCVSIDVLIANIQVVPESGTGKHRDDEIEVAFVPIRVTVVTVDSVVVKIGVMGRCPQIDIMRAVVTDIECNS